MKMEYVFESLKSFINAELSDNVTLPRGAARLCVDITAIKENYNSICREIGGGVELMPMVKANAYGSGAEIVANVLSNCKHLAVADVKEAALLRRVMTGSAATDTSFVIIYQPPVSDVQVIAENNYIAAVSNLAFAEALNAAAARLGKVAEVHVEIDTGAGRLGVQPNDCKAFFTALNMLANISVDGIFMHYSCADGLDDEDIAFTERQTSLFLQAIADAESVVGNIKYKHACNGAAIFHPKAAHFNMVRPGYMLYGYYPNEELRQRLKLLPALTFSTVIVHIKDVEPGTPIGYGRSFVTNRPSKIATVAVGYSDGVSRRLSNRGYMAINGQKAPIVGKVCMDLTMIDVTDISGEVNIGDEVFVFDNVNITIDDIAELCGTIGYEIIAGIEDKADRVERF
jgi:alanine racemase